MKCYYILKGKFWLAIYIFYANYHDICRILIGEHSMPKCNDNYCLAILKLLKIK